jgi:acetoin utilization deacetylase AcuC-like enzyme
MSAVVIGSVEAVDDHDTGAGHPERSTRLAAVGRGVRAAVVGGEVVVVEPRPATDDELHRVHEDRYLQSLERLAAAGGALDADTPVSAGSSRTARLSAGCALAAAEVLAAGRADAGFVALRPPGHHASARRGQGFCLVNNIAVVAAALVATGERVVIVDWDVHHGNGTQSIFYDEPQVLYVSLHQWPAYPGTGRVDETGGPNAPGATINIPLPPGATGDVALAAMDDVVAPAVARFAPGWVLVSAGFDAHRDDPLADLAWSAGDYADLARRVVGFAPRRGRVLAVLEGGYDLRALEASVTGTVAAFAGRDVRPEPATAGGPGREAVARAARVHMDTAR